MSAKLDPIKLSLLSPTKEDIASIKSKEVTVPDIFVPSTKDLHPHGLFSTEIFGLVGSDQRMRTFGYMDLKIKILHPLIYRNICKLKALYKNVMAGKSNAIWDDKEKDFVACEPSEGNTGYQFFMLHYKDIKFKTTSSNKRDNVIQLIQKHMDNSFLSYLLVLPAGLRDIEIKDEGKPQEEEMNGMYRKVLSLATIMPEKFTAANLYSVDTTRHRLQLAVNEVYEYIESLLKGKDKLLAKKFGGRTVDYSTSNVITVQDNEFSVMTDPRNVDPNTTIVNLWQYLKGNLPFAIFQTKDRFLNDIFSDSNTPVKLVNMKTLNVSPEILDGKTYDDWMSFEGLEQRIHKFGVEDIRHSPITVAGRYMSLIYKDKKKFFTLQDIDDLPKDHDVKNVSPITFTEFWYISVYKQQFDRFAINTRYPASNEGSVYPAKTYIKTTEKSQVLKEHSLIPSDSNSYPIDTDVDAIEFPIRDEKFFNSIAVSVKNLGPLGADL